MVEPLTGAVIVSLFFSEAIRKVESLQLKVSQILLQGWLALFDKS
jgi:hypothetical protein